MYRLPVSSPNFSILRQICHSCDAYLVLECGVLAGVQEFRDVLWTRDEHGVWEQLSNFLIIHNPQQWCSECVAAGQRMGGEVLRYGLGKDGSYHLIISVEDNNIKVVVFKRLRNKRIILLCWWEGVNSTILQYL